MSDSLGFFAEQGDGFVPQPLSYSPWSSTMINGSAVCALIARELERHHTDPEMIPGRLTVDMFAPVRRDRVTLRTSCVREGGRILVADAEMVQNEETVARASLVLLRASQAPPGETWERSERPAYPPADLAPVPDEIGVPVFGSGGHDWSHSPAPHQNAARKRVWFPFLPDAVLGEPSTPFVRAAAVAEASSLVCNWGSRGVGYINADLTLCLARLPEGPGLGIEADQHLNAAGVSVGTTTVYDRSGPVGTGAVVAMANAKRQVDFTDRTLGAENVQPTLG